MNIQQLLRRFLLCLLAWCALTIAPALAQTVKHVPLFTFHGDSGDDQFGFDVSGAGDVNGDGFADLIVGAPMDDNNGLSSGSARVLSGIDGNVLYEFFGDAAGEIFGWSVSGAGDVNDDGFADLVVAAPTNVNDIAPNGSARVLSGMDGSVLYTFNGDPTADFFGRELSGAGDVNGDGFADLIVGYPLNDSARVFSGVDGSVLYNFEGDLAGDLFGRKVSGAGDVNGDGFADLIVGAPMDDTINGLESGSARVFSGVDGSVLYTFNGDSAGDGLRAVSGAGDVNGDGFADLIVGAAGDDNNANGSGIARVFSGVDGSVLYTFEGDSSTDLFGIGESLGVSVSDAGDVNGDGFADLIAGAPNAAANGQRSGRSRVFSGADGSILYTFEGDPSNGFFGDSFGVSVSGAGDVNGDGMADFIVGASSGGANGGGYARLFVSKIIILGDCNLDGFVDFSDIPAFIEVLTNDGFLDEADFNQDEEVTTEDIAPFIEILIAR